MDIVGRRGLGREFKGRKVKKTGVFGVGEEVEKVRWVGKGFSGGPPVRLQLAGIYGCECICSVRVFSGSFSEGDILRALVRCSRWLDIRANFIFCLSFVSEKIYKWK